MTISEQPLEGVVLRYLQHMRTRHLRPVTIYCRQRTLARLSSWAGGPILYLTEGQLGRWQTETAGRGGPGYMRAEMSGLRGFYGFCVRERYLEVNPIERLDMPRMPRRLPRPMSDAKVAAALAGADDGMRVVLGLAAFAGLRACEVARLDWLEVGLQDGNLRVDEGKGGHGRMVPLSPVLAGLLTALPHRRGPVVRRLDGGSGPNQPYVISHRANDYLHGLGIPDSLHTLRHRFATVTYAHCRDLRAVQDLLGHASPVTTSTYALSSPSVAVQAVRDAGVLAA